MTDTTSTTTAATTTSSSSSLHQEEVDRKQPTVENITNDNELVRSNNKMMETPEQQEVGNEALEKASLISSINWLGRHVPVCVMNQLGNEVSSTYYRDDGQKKRVMDIISDLYNDDDDSDDDSDSDYCGSSRTSTSSSNVDDGHLSDLSDDDDGHFMTNKSSIMEKIKYDLSISEGSSSSRRSSNNSAFLTSLQEIGEGEENSDAEEEGFTGDKQDANIAGDENNDSEDKREREPQHNTTDYDGIKESSTPKSGNIDTSLVSKTDHKQSSIVDRPMKPKNSKSKSKNEIIVIEKSLPSGGATKHKCAMLFVDISGFTTLSKSLNPELLSVTINEYFQLIIDEIISHGGDILKFAGDAIFAEFVVDPIRQEEEEEEDKEEGEDAISTHDDAAADDDNDNEDDNEDDDDANKKHMSIEDCVTIAATCGAHIVSKCSDYPVYDKTSDIQITTLNVHCGLGVGEILGVHVGDNMTKREYVLLGDPIRQSTEAANNAAHGEFLASIEALRIMSKQCDLDEQLQSVLDNEKGLNSTNENDENTTTTNNNKAVLIANKSSFLGFQPQAGVLKDHHRWLEEINTTAAAAKTELELIYELWDVEALEHYRKLISLYVHPVVVDNDLAVSNVVTRSSMLTRQKYDTIQQRHTEEAELRSVYTMFISMPKIRVDNVLSGNAKSDSNILRLLNNIMNLVTKELTRFSGHLRQFIVDDKGLVLIATFGLRGSSYPNMVTERALPATIVIHNELQSELGVTNRIGATIGNAYCGIVGSVNRHEYAVLGPSVNLAARLMSSPTNPGILVDDAIRMKAGKSYSFNALDPVKAKGFVHPVPIFEPLSALERGWGKTRKNFVGRTNEINQLVGMAKEMMTPNKPARIAFITAESGVGKSATVVHAVERIRKEISRNRKRVVVAKHSCLEGDNLLPFSMLRSILPDLMMTETYYTRPDEDKSYASKSSRSKGSRSSLRSIVSTEGVDLFSCSERSDRSEIDWDNLSFASATSSVSALSRVHSSPDRLMSLCMEMEAPAEFMELVGHHLLGLDMEAITAAREMAGQEKSKGKPPSPQATVNFMAQAFQLCSRRARLTVVALDSVHHMDEMSWKVLQQLYITSRNLMIVCTCSARPFNDLTIDEQFWKDLNEKRKNEGRFVPIKLAPLGKSEIRTLISTELRLKEDEISDQFYNDVYTQCGGMPHFTHEILEIAKRQLKIAGKNADSLFGWLEGTSSRSAGAFASLAELILHRVDSFDATVRNVLNLCAVLGTSFNLMEISAVLQQFIGGQESQEDTHNEKLFDALDCLVREGILRQIFEGGDESNELDDFEEPQSPIDNSISLPNHVENDVTEDRVYMFCHDAWRQSILKLMLDSRKRDIHRIIATTLDVMTDEQNRDFASRVKLFTHWKNGGDFAKAATIALTIGKSFEEQGLHNQSIRIYEDSLETWRGADDSDDTIGGFDTQVVDSINVTDLEYIIKLHIAMGKCYANLIMAGESVDAYQNALEILQFAPAAHGIEDRTIVFPIFSGLFVALKFGQIEQDEECTYEQNLVRKFVNETRLNGDPVHYTRALAMQGEMYGRLGDFEKAFEAHNELKKVYNVDEHSAGICKAYGSDRSGQSFSASALWHVQQGNVKEALSTCRYVIDELMPKMEPRNVHNSCIMLYPAIWIMKDNGLALEAREVFVNLVVNCFEEHYGEGAFTFCLPIYEPTLMLLDLYGNQGGDVERVDEYLLWAQKEDNLRFGDVLNNSMGNFGRNADSISAEICLLLAKRADRKAAKTTLLKHGLTIANESIEFTKRKGMIVSYKQVAPVFNELETLSKLMEE